MKKTKTRCICLSSCVVFLDSQDVPLHSKQHDLIFYSNENVFLKVDAFLVLNVYVHLSSLRDLDFYFS